MMWKADITLEIHQTVVDSIGETKHEDVTNPAVHDVQHEWSKDEYPTNSTEDDEGLAIFPPPENNNEEKGFHTGTTGKESQVAQISFAHGHHWLLTFIQ